jgi:hypothetical protein
MKKLNGIFTNVDRALKIIAKVLFYICFVAGIVLIVIGLVKVLGVDGSFSRRELRECFAYLGAGLGAMVGSLSVLPLYGFGELISLCREMRSDMKKLDSNASKREEN